jgi:hypothetical protein
MIFNRCFVTGCDKNTEWMLPWFIKNFRQRSDQPIVFSNFGVSEKGLRFVEKHFDEIVDFTGPRHQISNCKWYLKPEALIECPGHQKVWIDTDCEILKNPDGIFARLVEDKLNIAVDKPWTIRKQETWHNSGVVGVIDEPKPLFEWANQCKMDNVPFTETGFPRGDQDSLHNLIGNDPMKRWIYINDLPNMYNWLRIQLKDNDDSPNKIIMHWTGQIGKEIIRKKMYEQGLSPNW